MNPPPHRTRRLARAAAVVLPALLALLGQGIRVEAAHSPQWVISGNETKIDLTSGSPRRIAPEAPDSLTLKDFATFPPRVTHLPSHPAGR